MKNEIKNSLIGILIVIIVSLLTITNLDSILSRHGNDAVKAMVYCNI
mgnify:CR=1 FL=1